jgi:hypothetical protein
MHSIAARLKVGTRYGPSILLMSLLETSHSKIFKASASFASREWMGADAICADERESGAGGAGA